MDDPAVLVLLLEQGLRSLKDHTTDFVFLANSKHYPDSCLCSFNRTRLNTTTGAQLSGEGPRESFAIFVEWVLVFCQSSLTVDFADNDTSPTHDPVPSPMSPHSAARQAEPTVDGEPSPEPEPITSDQVREPATSHTTEEVSVEHEEAEESPAHCTSTEGEQKLELGQMELINFEDIYADMPPFTPPSSELSVYPEPPVCPDLSACLGFPPTLPLLPHLVIPASATPPLSPDSPSAHPQPTISAVGLPRVCQFPSSPPPASESWTPPRPSDPTAPGSLVSTVACGLPAPPSSLVPPAPPRPVVNPPLPRDSSGCTSLL
ncbi:hypothetical protein M9458_039390, partial [Cirrhinus mrigala]